MIQYQPRPEDDILEITCIFVAEKKNLRTGVGASLFQSPLSESGKPRPCFGGEPPPALLTWAFEVPGTCPQHEFHKRMGFKRVGEDLFLLFYPSKDSARVPAEREYKPQEEDAGKTVIFYDPSCPFCIYFSACTRDLVREVAPDIQIRMINQSEARREWRRGERSPSASSTRERFSHSFRTERHSKTRSGGRSGCSKRTQLKSRTRGPRPLLRQPHPLQLFHSLEILVLGVDDEDTAVQG